MRYITNYLKGIMKASQNKERQQVTKFDSSSQQHPAATEFMLQLYRNRAIPRSREQSNEPRESQLTSWLIADDATPQHTVDMHKQHLNVGYILGNWKLERYPTNTARKDTRSSLNKKAQNLQAIGVDERTIKNL